MQLRSFGFSAYSATLSLLRVTQRCECKVLTSVWLKVQFSWDVTLCLWVRGSGREPLTTQDTAWHSNFGWEAPEENHSPRRIRRDNPTLGGRFRKRTTYHAWYSMTFQLSVGGSGREPLTTQDTAWHSNFGWEVLEENLSPRRIRRDNPTLGGKFRKRTTHHAG